VLDVPCNTNIRDLDGRRPPRKRARKGPKRKVPFVRVDTWARKLPPERWTRLTIRDGAKGPLEVEAVSARVRAKRSRRIGPEERVLVIRTLDPKPDWTYSLSNAPPETPLAELVGARSSRHRVEEVLQEAKGEVGLSHYEVRSWMGWHHRVTLAFLALWFLVLERGRMGGKDPGGDGGADAGDLHRATPQDWGVFDHDDICLVNNSPFPLTGVGLDVAVEAPGAARWSRVLSVEWIEPGATHRWRAWVAARAKGAAGKATLSCDQQK